ncbi:MAG: hypothetical protein SGI92_22610 [Bryobacteraceae bacterium]|nr:hypothetical protein [Bryobacteraceae bacterium]
MQQSEPANFETSGDVNPPELQATTELAVVPKPHYHWYDKLAAVMAAIFCFEVGLFLLVYPWVTEWEPGPGFFPLWFRQLWDNPAFRGALSGLGVLNIWISFVEVFRFRRFSN